MRRSVLLAVLGMVLLSAPSGVLGADADVDGATPGKWTMDVDAAKALAQKKKLPILLNFSGSDWCGWCKLMERSVFSEKDWQDYAKANVVMVVIDFPKNKDIVPAKYVERNKKLKAKYEVSGFPTFVVLDDDGETELGRLGAGRDMTPTIFIAQLKKLCRYRAANVAKYARGLKSKDKAKYMRIINQIPECNKGIKRCQRQISDEKLEVKRLEKKLADAKSSAQEFRASQLGADELKEYKKLNAELVATEKELADWMEAGPERNEENTKKYESMNAAVQKLSDKLSEY
jgi:thioredoxin-related protein